MPPQPKKSRVIASHATSRQTNRQSRKQVERSEDEEDEISDGTNNVGSGAEDESQEPGTSPNKANGRIGQMMENIVGNQHNRRNTRKQNVLESYDDAYTTAQSSIATLFDEHEKQSASAHRAQLKALTDLLAQKAKIEASMAEKLISLRASYHVHSRELEAVLAFKIEQLQ